MPARRTGVSLLIHGEASPVWKTRVADHRIVAIRKIDRVRFLVLDLQVVAERAAHPIGLDEPSDKRIRTVGIAEIHAGSHPLDVVVSATQPNAGHLVEMPTFCCDAAWLWI